MAVVKLPRRSFDHLVGACEHSRGHIEAERFGGLEVQHGLVLGWRLHRQVGGLLALEDAVDVRCGALAKPPRRALPAPLKAR